MIPGPSGGYVSAFAPTVGILMASRFVVGLGVGAAFVPVDMLAEACPEGVRTTKTQVANLSFSCGVVLVTMLGMVLLDAGGWGPGLTLCAHSGGGGANNLPQTRH